MKTLIQDDKGNEFTYSGWDYASVRDAVGLMFRNGAKYVSISRFGRLEQIIFP